MDESVSVLSEDIDAGLVRAALRQITSSACFVPAGRLRRFLQFAVERTLEGQCEELKEYPIGLRVFDRKESFDPRLDPIVRVEAGRLRARLKQYYETDGRQDELLIEFHKGGYVPTFSLRRTVNEPVPEAECARKAVVVLPFQDQSPARDQDYFCHGVTEEIIIALTKVEGLRVTARASTFHLQERHSDWHEVAVSLGVSHVVQGSVRKDGNRLRITAHLIDAKLDCYLWSETFDREVRDVFAIQEEISQAIVNTLRLQLNAPLVRSSTQSSRAYKLYLKGRYYWNKRSEEGLREAVRYFDSALQEDGQFALASAGLADSYSLLGNYGVLPPHSVRPKALNAALQAVQTAPELAETRT
ncbi:MAG TPA: hypothetical protein VJ837_03620, partial [Candidatus Paceibacterota bacterium]|nr:hypothetical protein [Candidatus Paceibacterota bacterium]